MLGLDACTLHSTSAVNNIGSNAHQSVILISVALNSMDDLHSATSLISGIIVSFMLYFDILDEVQIWLRVLHKQLLLPVRRVHRLFSVVFFGVRNVVHNHRVRPRLLQSLVFLVQQESS
mgnify:CR=1 FL=1